MVSAEDFASVIARRWQDSVLAIIDVGKLLMGAKNELPHGEFESMVESNKVPFGTRTARRLMAIATHSILSNRTHASDLPPSWMTVYELTRAPDQALTLWLTDGTIHPEMERKDVLSLLRSLRASTRKAIASRPGKYQLILADPPWEYDFMGTDSRAIENQYETQSYTDIAEDPDVLDFIDDDCVLFLWATSPKLVEALFVLEAWGFDHKTNLVWVKDRIGMGYYFRNRHELLLIGARGSMHPPDESARPDSVLEAPRRINHNHPILSVWRFRWFFLDLLHFFGNLQLAVNAADTPCFVHLGYEGPVFLGFRLGDFADFGYLDKRAPAYTCQLGDLIPYAPRFGPFGQLSRTFASSATLSLLGRLSLSGSELLGYGVHLARQKVCTHCVLVELATHNIVQRHNVNRYVVPAERLTSL